MVYESRLSSRMAFLVHNFNLLENETLIKINNEVSQLTANSPKTTQC